MWSRSWLPVVVVVQVSCSCRAMPCLSPPAVLRSLALWRSPMSIAPVEVQTLVVCLVSVVCLLISPPRLAAMAPSIRCGTAARCSSKTAKRAAVAAAVAVVAGRATVSVVAAVAAVRLAAAFASTAATRVPVVVRLLRTTHSRARSRSSRFRSTQRHRHCVSRAAREVLSSRAKVRRRRRSLQ